MAKITDVRLDKPVEIEPSIISGSVSKSIAKEKTLWLEPIETQALVDHLGKNSKLRMIESSLQGLIKREDGTLLLSAFPSAEEFREVVSGFDGISNELIERWISNGCNEIYLHFERKD